MAGRDALPRRGGGGASAWGNPRRRAGRRRAFDSLQAGRGTRVPGRSGLVAGAGNGPPCPRRASIRARSPAVARSCAGEAALGGPPASYRKPEGIPRDSPLGQSEAGCLAHRKRRVTGVAVSDRIACERVGSWVSPLRQRASARRRGFVEPAACWAWDGRGPPIDAGARDAGLGSMSDGGLRGGSAGSSGRGWGRAGAASRGSSALRRSNRVRSDGVPKDGWAPQSARVPRRRSHGPDAAANLRARTEEVGRPGAPGHGLRPAVGPRRRFGRGRLWPRVVERGAGGLSTRRRQRRPATAAARASFRVASETIASARCGFWRVSRIIASR